MDVVQGHNRNNHKLPACWRIELLVSDMEYLDTILVDVDIQTGNHGIAELSAPEHEAYCSAHVRLS